MFDAIPSQLLLLVTSVGAIFMAVFVMVMRLRSRKKPINEKKIIIPPIAMSTGALMFIFEEFRVAPIQILEASALGIVFSTLLIATSKFEVRDQAIYMKRSKAFIFILVGLLILRIILKLIFSNSLDVGELGGMFFILAWSMIIPWRFAMLVQFKKLKKAVLN